MIQKVSNLTFFLEVSDWTFLIHETLEITVFFKNILLLFRTLLKKQWPEQKNKVKIFLKERTKKLVQLLKKDEERIDLK